MYFKLLFAVIILIVFNKCDARSLDINFNPYEEVARSTGYLQKSDEFDRLIDMLVDLRDIDFGIIDSWKNPKPTYKGCEPLKTSKNSVHC
ncbi:hypothetical protein PVAND_000439 [Polypedilum vanderplanki]|uniref:Uncharacterized protein n=1 Tax=Polypedilum vanderplanki TaxID=319348 RepID=A0A9J6BLA4_POLVA|nr:hypothetical protein PVAND_000439 [Polypedilum vanderplanki]